MNSKNSNLTRRKFLATSAAGLASAGLANIAPGLAVAQTSAETKQSATGEIIYRTLGRTGMKIPIVSMGSGASTNAGMVQAAYEAGVRHFDSAANYQLGANEQMIGRVIKKLGIRDKVNIGTKIYTPAERRNMTPDLAKKKLLKLIEGSLKRLRTDYVDIIYFHDVNSADDVKDPVVIEAFNYIKEQGKARAIGITTHSNMAAVINEAVSAKAWDVILTSFNFTMADDAEMMAAVKNAGENGIGLIAMKVMAGGGRWPNPETRQDYDNALITTAMFKWILRNEQITTIIPGFNNHEQLRLDITVASNLELNEREKKFLSDNRITLSMGFCRQCKKCLASCPNDVDVPNLMRTHMYAAQYGDFRLARNTIDGIPKNQGLVNCTSCPTCTAECTNTVDIGRRIEELKLMYA